MNRRKTYHIIQVIYESQDRGLASKIVQNTFGENGVVKFRDTRITAIDINAIFFMLHSSEHIYKLRYAELCFQKLISLHNNVRVFSFVLSALFYQFGKTFGVTFSDYEPNLK